MAVVYIALLVAYNRDERTMSPESYRMGGDCYFLRIMGCLKKFPLKTSITLLVRLDFLSGCLNACHYQQFSVFHSLGPLSHSIYSIEFDKPPASTIIIWRHITSERTFKHFYCPIYGLIFNNTCWLLFTQSANRRLHWFQTELFIKGIRASESKDFQNQHHPHSPTTDAVEDCNF